MADDGPPDSSKDSSHESSSGSVLGIKEHAEQHPEPKSEAILEDTTPLVDSGRIKREPPTIDLDPSEVSSETRTMAGDPAPESEHIAQPPHPEGALAEETLAEETLAEETLAEDAVAAESVEAGPTAASAPPPPASRPISPWVIAPVSGAVAAALVIGVGWMLGWPQIQPPAPAPVAAAPQVSAAAVDGLTARVAGLESKISQPVAPATDSAALARIAALEKSQASLRDDLTALKAQSQKLAGEIGAAKSVPGEAIAAAPAVDLAAINARLDQIESAARAQPAPEAAKPEEIKPEEIKPEATKPADDPLLRRVVVASVLELSVRQGEPFAATLDAAKSLAPDAAALKPLEGFAATGVPTAAMLSRELLTLIPKLSPPAPQADTPASSLVERLEAGAAKLVRIERIDAVGTDRGAVVARITAAALRNDSNEARRELKTLPAADRAAAQSWLDKADARDAALAVSRQFATDAMAALAKPTQ